MSLVAAVLLFWAYRTTPRWVELHAEGMRCLRSDRAIKIWKFWRLIGVVIAAVLVLVVRPRAARLAQANGVSVGGVLRVGLAIVLALVTSSSGRPFE